jgi:hypothetical protein
MTGTSSRWVSLVIGLYVNEADDGNLRLATSPICCFQTLKPPFEGCSC